MMKLQNHIVTFANNDTKLFEAFNDYWNHYCALNKINDKGREYDTSMSFDEKETRLNEALQKFIFARAGIPYGAVENVAGWFNHPLARYETFNVVSALIDSVLPQTIIDNIGMFTEIRVGGFGDSFTFDITPRDLFTVSLSGRKQRTSQIYKQYNGQVPLIPENHEITVGVSLYKVLSGKDSLARLIIKALRSIETKMTLDAYNTFATALDAVDSTADTGLQVTGYSQDELVGLIQRIGAWNNSKPVILGTQRALVNVLPDDANYRYDVESDYVKIGYIRQAFGSDVMVMPQVANYATEFGVSISDSRLWIVSPARDKLVKLCLEGQMLSYVDQSFDNANLEQNATMQKAWKAGIATSSLAGQIVLS